MKLNLFGGKWFTMDIGSSAIRVVQLKNSSQLMHYGSIPVVKPDKSNAPLEPAELTRLVSQVVQSSGITAKDVVIGVPTEKTFTAIIDLPKLKKESDYAKTIHVQAEEHIPMPINEVDLDWKVLGDSPTEQGKNEVLIVAVQKEFNKQRIEIVEAAGLEVVGVEPDAHALTRAVIPKDITEPNHLVLEMGNLESDLIAVVNGLPRLVRNIPIGIKKIVYEASQNMSLTEEQARQHIYKFGLDKTKLQGQVAGAIKTSVDGIVTEISKSIKFVQNRYANTVFQDILLSGGVGYIPAMDQYIQQQVKVPTFRADSWVNIDYQEKQQQELAAINSGFAVVVGLARRKQ